MEGFLFKKGRGDSSFGRRNWKRRWFVLEDQLLTYYEDLDMTTGIPFSQKGMTDISGCEIVPITEVDKKFAFVVKHPKRHSLYLQADDAKMLSAWIKALTSASIEPPKVVDYELCYEKLGLLSSGKNPTISEVNRAYRKAALKVHPDKGGDMVEFKKLQEAFEQLTAKIEEEEENNNYNIIRYEAVIEKGPQGVGVGMVVIENSKKKIIQIKRVMPSMMLKTLTASANGAIRPGDVIVMVGNEDVEQMPLTRVVQKIGDHRVPVGTTVRLTLTRRINRETGLPEEVQFEGEPVAPPAEPVYAPAPSSDDIDESTPNGSFPDTPNTPNNRSSYNFNTAPPDISASPPNSPLSHSQSAWGSFGSPTGLDPVQYVSVMAENEELKSDLETSLQQLNEAYHERDQFKTENKQLRNELSKYKALLSESLKRQKLLELQVAQNLVYGTLSAEQIAQSNSELAAISARLQSDQPIQVSSELNSYMHTIGLDSGDVKHDRTKASQRTAITASAAVDKSGVIVQKWATAGDSVVNKLSRFEEHILNIERSRHAAESTTIFQPPQPVVVASVAAKPAPQQEQQAPVSSEPQQQSPYTPVVTVTSVPVTSNPASPYSMGGAAFSVSAAIKASNVLSPTATLSNAYKGLASGSGTVSPLGGSRPFALSRAASEAPNSAFHVSSNGSVSSATRPALSPVAMNRASSVVSPAGKAPLVFAKRAPPPVPMNRVASSFQ